MSAIPPSLSIVIPVFGTGANLHDTLRRVTSLRLGTACPDVILIDDGPGFDLERRLQQRGVLSERLRVVTSGRNQGRAGAINLGAGSAHTDLLLILDADCLPAERDFLGRHWTVLAEGADASIGPIQGQVTDTFWDRYVSDSNARRLRHAQRDPAAMTTANMMVRREVFTQAGGFDEAFSRYGFEDRDLLLRLARNGARLRVNTAARALHSDAVSFPVVFRKMQECGGSSGPLFRSKHPREYHRMGYARLDASLHPLMAWFLVPLGRFVRSHTAKFESLLHAPWLPFPARKALARGGSALAYCLGTFEAGRGVVPSKPMHDA